jgi:hypothetical protein
LAQDPLSHVASWLTPASATSADDPVLALIAEAERLDALWLAASNRRDKIFDTLPRRVKQSRRRELFG